MNDIDAWMIRGFSGLLRLLQDRVQHQQCFSEQNLSQIKIYQRQLEDLIGSIENYPNLANEKHVSLAGHDRWLLAGFQGLFQLVEDRLKEATLDSNNLDTLKSIHMRMGQVILKMENLTVHHNKTP